MTAHFQLARVSARLLCLAILLEACLCACAQTAPAAQPLIAQGQRALQAGDFAQAARSFEEARELAPGDREVFRDLVMSYLQGRRFPQAVTAGKEAVERWPRDADFRHWLGLAYFQSRDAAA